MAWTVVPESEAKQHRLYGVGGWLMLFLIGNTLAPLALLGPIVAVANGAGIGLAEFLAIDHPAMTFLKSSFVLSTTVAIVVLWMAVKKSPFFRMATTWLLLGEYPISMLISTVTPFDGRMPGLAESAVGWIATCLVWVTYLQSSKRVRITFEHSVRTAEHHQQHLTKSPTPSVENFDPAPVESGLPSVVVPPAVAAPVQMASFGSMETPSEEHWAQALHEVDGAERRAGLWARSFSQAKGDEAVAKANYIEIRAKELAKENQTQFEKQSALQLQQTEDARIEALREAEDARIEALREEQIAFDRLPKESWLRKARRN